MTESALKVLLLLGLMAAVAVAETWIPLRDIGQTQGHRRRQNLTLTILFLLMNLVLTTGLVGVLLWMEQRNFGLLRYVGLPTTANMIISIVILDFFAYTAHVVLHKVSWLWRVHRVHHSDSAVDVTTSFRQHPLETVLRFGFTAVPAIFMGISPVATAVYRLISGINALFEHANIRVLPIIDRRLCWALVTPHMHKIHHSRKQLETDSNYGNILSSFDRLFGTFTPTVHVDQVRYGLDEFDANHHLGIADLIKMPWKLKHNT